MYRYILFDLDGTLTDPKEGITKCVQYALQYFGIEADTEDLVDFIGPPLLESFQKYYQLDDAQGHMALKKYRERFKDIGIFENGVYPGRILMWWWEAKWMGGERIKAKLLRKRSDSCRSLMDRGRKF